MPFTPKFVDLVKNSTTVQGTGAVSLGAALSGFTGFAAVCVPGDQFYYCIQGVDKPAEREVGRGTFQADGTIAREALGGSLRNFSNGTKTIALIAAAEWFARLEALANAPPPSGGGGSAAPSPLFTAAAGSIIPASIVAITSAGYSITGVGEARYVQDAAITAATVIANARTQFLAADGRGFKLDPTQRLTAEMFGARANDSSGARQAANLAAIKAALEYFPTPSSKFSPTIHLGPGAYYISDTLEPQAVWHLQGQGSGLYTGGTGGVNVTRLIAPVNKTVVRVSAATFGTAGYVGGSGGVNAGGSIIEGMSIEQASGGSDLTAHGIHARATPIIRNCVFVAIAGDAIHIRGSSSPENSSGFGSPNMWKVIDCQAHSCGGNGLYVEGSDANAGYSIGFDTRPEVLGCGILDRSQLANAHYGVHLAGYGNKGVHHNGFIWQLVTHSNTGTEPGTNAQVWSKLIATTPSANFPAWSAATPYLPRLPFLILNGSPVYGYTEFGAVTAHSNGLVQGTMNGTTETNVIGTESSLGFTNRRGIARYRTDAGNGPLWPTYPAVGSHEEVSIGSYDQANGEDGRAVILRYGTGSGEDFSLSWNGTRNIAWRLGGRIMAWLTGKETLDTFGRSTAQPGIMALGPHAIGGSGDGTNDSYFGDYARIHMGVFNGVPTAGHHAQGEFAWNLINPSGGVLGWSCTASGTPGTWTPVPVAGFTGSFTGNATFIGTVGVTGTTTTTNASSGYGFRINPDNDTYLDNSKPSVGYGQTIYYRSQRHVLQAGTAGAVADVLAVNPPGAVVTGTLSATGAITQNGSQVWHAGNLTQFASGVAGYVPASGGGTANFLRADGSWATPGGGGGSGTVTSVAVTSANGISGSVASATTAAAITLTLGAITPGSVAATGTVTGSNLSGTNSGDQTITLTGDVTGSGTGSFAATIGANAVSFAKLVAASQASFVGATAAGNFGELTPAAATAILSAMVGANGTVAGTKGLVPVPAASDNLKLLRGDGAWVDGNAGTVTTLSVVSANGVSGSVANAGTTPAITLSLGAITPASVAAAGGITSSGGGVGYATGAGGAVSQATSRTTGATLNKLCGTITLFSTTTTAGQVTTFTVTNSTVAARDVVLVHQASGNGVYFCTVSRVLAGSFNLSVHTPAAVSPAEAPVFNFAVIKAAAA